MRDVTPGTSVGQCDIEQADDERNKFRLISGNVKKRKGFKDAYAAG